MEFTTVILERLTFACHFKVLLDNAVKKPLLCLTLAREIIDAEPCRHIESKNWSFGPTFDVHLRMWKVVHGYVVDPWCIAN